MENDQAMPHAAPDEDEKLEGSKSSDINAKVLSRIFAGRASTKSVDTVTEGERTRNDFSRMGLSTETEKDSNAAHASTAEDELLWTDNPSDPWEKTLEALIRVDTDKTLAENYNCMGYPTPILSKDLFEREMYHRLVDEKKFAYMAFLGFGLANFMSYAAHFCEYEARDKAEIISIGSGNGTVDREIISTHRKHFGEELIEITLVDPNPDYEVHFKGVDDLIKARPEAVGNCILLIIWPELMSNNNGYDMDAIRKLQPLAALVLYDPAGVSGSEELTGFLRDKTGETVNDFIEYDYDERTVGLDNYAVELVTRLEVYCDAGGEVEAFGMKSIMEPGTRHLSLRLVKLKKLYVK